MRRILGVSQFLLGIGGLILIQPAANAMDFGGHAIQLQPRFEVGAAFYELEFGATNQTIAVPSGEQVASIDTEKLTFNGVLPTIGGGVTFFADNFLIDLSAQRAFDGHDRDSGTIATDLPDSTTTADPAFAGDFDRNEYAISVGYTIAKRFSLFAGYKWVKNTFDDVRGAGPATVQSSAGTLNGTFVAESDFEFKHSGPFVGAGYNWDFSDTQLDGSLSLRFGAGFFDGELNVSAGPAFIDFENGARVPQEISSEELFATKGETIGFSFGATWIGATPIGGLSYVLNANGYSYRFDADDSGKADVGETFINLKLGLSYTF